MNETELYFARQNLLWNIGIYILIGLGIFFIIMLIAVWIYDCWKWRKPQKRKVNK